LWNLSNEPSLLYSLKLVSDKFENNKFKTTSDLLRNKTIYLETSTSRYELSEEKEKQTYKWGKIRNPLYLTSEVMNDKNKVCTIPLPSEFIEKYEARNVKWKEILWGNLY
jgi:hypothetical protein